MERKYRTQKKTIMILSIIAVLLIAVIVYQQVRITNVKAEQDEYWDEQHALKEQELEDAKAEYESKDLKDTEEDLKKENKFWKDYSKDIVKAYEKGEDISAIVAEYEGTAEEDTADDAAADDAAADDAAADDAAADDAAADDAAADDAAADDAAADDAAADEEETTDEE